MRLLVQRGATLPPGEDFHHDIPSEVVAYVDGAQHWTALHRAADARDPDALRECLAAGARPTEAVEAEHSHMRTALAIAGSTEYPTARPVCEECLALLRVVPLVKGVAVGAGAHEAGRAEHHLDLPPRVLDAPRHLLCFLGVRVCACRCVCVHVGACVCVCVARVCTMRV